MSTSDLNNKGDISSQAASELGDTANSQISGTPRQQTKNAFLAPSPFTNLNHLQNNSNKRSMKPSRNNGNYQSYQNSESELDNSGSDLNESNITTSKHSNTNRIIQLEKDYKAVKSENAILRAEMATLQKAIKSLTKTVNEKPTPLMNIPQVTAQPPLFSNIVKANIERTAPTQAEINVLNAFTSERNEQARRESNVLIMGVKDTSDDLAKSTVERIFAELNIDTAKIVSVYRFKQSTNNAHPPIIKVCLPNKDDRLSVLKASRQLREKPTFAKVYINPDLTFAQRSQEKLLIAERNAANELRLKSTKPEDKTYYFGIRNSVVKRIPCTPTP